MDEWDCFKWACRYNVARQVQQEHAIHGDRCQKAACSPMATASRTSLGKAYTATCYLKAIGWWTPITQAACVALTGSESMYCLIHLGTRSTFRWAR